MLWDSLELLTKHLNSRDKRGFRQGKRQRAVLGILGGKERLRQLSFPAKVSERNRQRLVQENSNMLMDILQLLQIGPGVMNIPRCHSHSGDDTVVGVSRLVRQVIKSATSLSCPSPPMTARKWNGSGMHSPMMTSGTYTCAPTENTFFRERRLSFLTCFVRFARRFPVRRFNSSRPSSS